MHPEPEGLDRRAGQCALREVGQQDDGGGEGRACEEGRDGDEPVGQGDAAAEDPEARPAGPRRIAIPGMPRGRHRALMSPAYCLRRPRFARSRSR